MNILKILEIIFLILCREAPDIFRPILQQTARQRAAEAAASNGKIVATRAVRSYGGSVILHPLIINLCSFCFWRNSPQWTSASSFTRFLDHTQRRTTQAVGLLWTSDQLVAETST